jgi:hypothetical protein
MNAITHSILDRFGRNFTYGLVTAKNYTPTVDIGPQGQFSCLPLLAHSSWFLAGEDVIVFIDYRPLIGHTDLYASNQISNNVSHGNAMDFAEGFSKHKFRTWQRRCNDVIFTGSCRIWLSNKLFLLINCTEQW